MELSNAVMVITGGGSGIGRAAALSAVARGAKVVVTDVNADRAGAVAEEIGDAAVGAACDVTDLAALEGVRDLALERFGRVDIVMSNVGILAVGNVEDIPFEAWQRIIDVNLLGTVRVNQVFLPILLEQGSGHVVYTASTAGLFPYGFDRLPYTTTKHAIVGMAESLSLYLRPKGIGVSCLCPAGVATNIGEQIAFYGDLSAPRGPNFGLSTAEEVGEIVADGIEQDRFLLLTAPEVEGELRLRGNDVEAYLAKCLEELS